jgi:hypothetical protein
LDPHILHVLCHGGSAAGLRSLFLASATDDGPATDPLVRGSVAIPSGPLAATLLQGSPLLVVLSACDTASVGDGPALANEIVSAGVPAVIGMRRIVDLGAANTFCKALYPALLELVTAKLMPGTPAILDWAGALCVPRTVLGGADPSTSSDWTDPVLYAQGQPLQVVTVPPAPAKPEVDLVRLRGKRDKLRTFLSTADPTMPADVIAKIAATVAEIESTLAGAGAPV